MKKKLSIVLIIILLITQMSCIGIPKVSAKNSKTVISRNKIQMSIGKIKTIKIKNATKKVKWKIGNKKIVKIVKKAGAKNNTIKIKGLKAGRTKITAKCSKKKYIVKVIVKRKNRKKEIKQQTVVRPVETTTQPQSIKTEDKPPVIEDEKMEITGEVVNNNLKIDEVLKIEYTVKGLKEEESIYYGYGLGKLEILEDGIWKRMPYNPEPIIFPDLAVQITGSGSFIRKIPISKYYIELRAGHYRYTFEIGNIDVPTEFDMVSL
ncbi:MAG: hypothetical protein HFG28_02395 [Eubacterium sp.]|nr:hypothetical protein [Eubacterium sp.]